MDDVTVPDLRGRRAVDAWLQGQMLGLACQCRGPIPNSRVVEQDPAPGTVVQRQAVLTLHVLVDPGDLDGVREPRRPLPQERSGHGEKPLPHG